MFLTISIFVFLLGFLICGALQLTPHRSATDGFFIAVMERAD